MKPSINEILETTDRVVAYGCSYTAGMELMDHVHMGMSFENCNKIKKLFSSNAENMSKFREYFKMDQAGELNRQHSWAAYLSRKLDKSFENRAEGGAGLDQIYFKIYNDLTSGLISKNDLVVVGLTDTLRIIQFGPNKVGSLILGWHLSENNPGHEKLIELFDNDWLCFNHYKTLKLMLSLSDKINIRFQPMISMHSLERQGFLKYVYDYSNQVWQDVRPFILSENDFLELKEGQRLCGFMHHPVDSHIDLADRIYSKITNTGI
jgi:hypothetical protein